MDLKEQIGEQLKGFQTGVFKYDTKSLLSKALTRLEEKDVEHKAVTALNTQAMYEAYRRFSSRINEIASVMVQAEVPGATQVYVRHWTIIGRHDDGPARISAEASYERPLADDEEWEEGRSYEKTKYGLIIEEAWLWEDAEWKAKAELQAAESQLFWAKKREEDWNAAVPKRKAEVTEAEKKALEAMDARMALEKRIACLKEPAA